MIAFWSSNDTNPISSTTIPTWWSDDNGRSGTQGTGPTIHWSRTRVRYTVPNTSTAGSAWVEEQLSQIERIRKAFEVPELVWLLRVPPWMTMPPAQLPQPRRDRRPRPRGYQDAPRRPGYRGARRRVS